MAKPVLIVMAAGMGSRYGGLKQIDKVTDAGEIILDFSLYDAMMAGFEEAIFIIRKEHEEAFRELLDDRAGRYMKISYAFQELTDLPEGYMVPEDREKPWGTCHAVYAARGLVKGPFAVINSDDYYGASAFMSMYQYLEEAQDTGKYQYSMVGYNLKNTITENGSVSRGVCQVDDAGMLVDLVERTKIFTDGDKILCKEGEDILKLSPEATVSMNFWGFTKSMMEEIEKRFPTFLEETIKDNPLKGEYFLPKVVDDLIKCGKAEVRVLKSQDKWFGVTYKEDKEVVVSSLKQLKDHGIYPEVLWK